MAVAKGERKFITLSGFILSDGCSGVRRAVKILTAIFSSRSNAHLAYFSTTSSLVYLGVVVMETVKLLITLMVINKYLMDLEVQLNLALSNRTL